MPTVNSRLTAIWEKVNNGQQFFKGDKNSSVTVTYKDGKWGIQVRSY